ncbi:hypothetical protein [Yoonia sp. R2-816]
MIKYLCDPRPNDGVLRLMEIEGHLRDPDMGCPCDVEQNCD